MLTAKQLERYFRRKRARGKSLVGQALDTATLLLLAFFAVFLLLRGQDFPARPAALLAALATAIAAVLLRLFRAAALSRFVPREVARLSRELVKNRLLLMDAADFLRLCEQVTGVAAPIPLQRAEPVDADALLKILRTAAGKPVTVCTSAPLSPAAQALLKKTRRPITVAGPDALLDAALADPALRPGPADIHDAIEAQLAKTAGRRRPRAVPFAEGASKKYLFAAAALLVFSFLTRYTLYYRMMAGLCVSIAAMRFLLARDAHARNAS